jgi:lysophospholipase L1-like esterase
VLHAPVSGAPADLSVLPLVGLVADAVTGGSVPRKQSWAWTENVPGLITPTSIAWSASIDETLAFGGCGAAPARRLAGVRGPTCGTYVALGDSYSSGAGLSRVDPDEGDGGSCRRSSLAYPRLVAKALEREVVHVACSGAKTAHVLGVGWQGEPPQIERIDERTTLVTVTVGGNDVGFARVLEACIAPAAVRRKPCPAARKRFERALGGVASSLLETYGAIVERASPIATIAVVAYPRFVPPPARKPGKASRSRKCTVVRSPIPLVGIVTWSEQEVRWFFDMINALNSQIRASVIAAGGVHPTSRIVLADPNPMFLGHDICQRKRGNDDDGDAVGESWFGQVQLIRGLKEAYFHPTLEGHRAIAQAVVAAVDAS